MKAFQLSDGYRYRRCLFVHDFLMSFDTSSNHCMYEDDKTRTQAISHPRVSLFTPFPASFHRHRNPTHRAIAFLGSALGQQRLPQRGQCHQRGATQACAIPIRSAHTHALLSIAHGSVSTLSTTVPTDDRRRRSSRSQEWCYSLLVVGQVPVSSFHSRKSRRRFTIVGHAWKSCVTSTTANSYSFRVPSVTRRSTI